MSVSAEERRGAGGGQDESSSSPSRSGPRSADGPSPRPSRRSFSAEYKLAIVAEYENAPNGEKGAILRREGLYSSHVIEWTRARDAGALEGVADSRRSEKRPRRSAEAAELERLRARNAKLEAELGKTRTALDIMGKAHALLEQLSESADDQNPPAPPAEEVLNTAFRELRDAQVSIAASCRLTGRSRATHYRHADPHGVALGPVHGPPRPRRAPPSTLGDDERAQVLAVLNSPTYRDLAIPQVWARELDEGRYWCSESSMYRIAREAGQSRERRAQASHPPRVRPELVAHGPNQVWSWDITALKGPRKGEWYKLYAVLDIFSRYAPGWLVANAEDAVVAKDFLNDAIARNLVAPQTIHADRGGSMTSKPVSDLMIDLGVSRTHSRPRQATLDRARARHPERFSRRPRPPRLPAQAWINQPEQLQPTQQDPLSHLT